MSVSPNGHPNTAKRLLLDKGVQYVLECCRAMFNFAAKRRHLPPYAENPFAALEIDRIPVETARRVELFTSEQLREFLTACDSWQYPVFLTLLMTGLRPGELCHLLLPDDLDLCTGVVRVRNKPRLGWQVKTRNQRDVPLLPELVNVLRSHLSGRETGPVFRRRTWGSRFGPLDGLKGVLLDRELKNRMVEWERQQTRPCCRSDVNKLSRTLWSDLGAVAEDRVRLEFIRVCRSISLGDQTAPKVLRHQFATILQEGRVDPLVRNILMGHASAEGRSAGYGLGMTAVYTHTRPETIREQMASAFYGRLWLANPTVGRTRPNGQV